MVFCSSLILFSLIFLSTGYLSYDSLPIALVSFWYLPYESLPPLFLCSLEISSVLCRTLVFSDTLPCGIPVVFLWFLYSVLLLSSIVYSLVWCTLSPGTALILVWAPMYSPGIILSPIGMMFTRPDFFTGKVLVKVPIGDMTDTIFVGWGCLVPRQELKKIPALNPTVSNHTLYEVVLSNRGVGMRKPPAKKKKKRPGATHHPYSLSSKKTLKSFSVLP